LIYCQLLPLLLLSSTTWLNHLVLDQPVGLFPLNFNSNALLSILVLSMNLHVVIISLLHSVKKF
jgi:hypothetical protein